MIARVYVSYDVIAQEGSSPFIAKTDGLAVRLFKQAQSRIDTELVDPRDFQLYCIGKYDSERMIITGEAPMVIPTALEGDDVEGI
ncbi:hypothetical protein AGMMS4956_20840 [Bacteroidia bacterium]|nr:hypothetical protein AGMMS4956_20840 [Bacteroidia bacterium]